MERTTGKSRKVKLLVALAAACVVFVPVGAMADGPSDGGGDDTPSRDVVSKLYRDDVSVDWQGDTATVTINDRLELDGE